MNLLKFYKKLFPVQPNQKFIVAVFKTLKQLVSLCRNKQNTLS